MSRDEIGYLGGLFRRGADAVAVHGHGRAHDPAWERHTGTHVLRLWVGGDRYGRFSSDRVTVLVRGYASLPDPGSPRSPDGVAGAVYRHYREHGELPCERWEGSFTLVLLDADCGRVLLYRNLVGNGFTYYTECDGGLVFGNNLAALAGAVPAARQDAAALPALFLYRYVPGRGTLFENIFRLMPGEQVVFGPDGLKRVQRQTIGDLREGRRIGRDAVDRIEETMCAVLTDCAAFHPDARNLLSGGVDSSYIQAHWNAVRSRGEGESSFGISVDHPDTRAECEYALSSARALGTRHTLVPADGAYADYLLNAIAGTGELPHHVQSAYFLPLAEAMAGRGATAGLCGQGADALFGLGGAVPLQHALILRKYLPSRTLRRLTAAGAAAAERNRICQYLELADHIEDVTGLDHPLNRVGIFTDWTLLFSCCAVEAVKGASDARRSLLGQYRVTGGLLEQYHACDFLSDSIDSAAIWTALFNRGGGELIGPYLDSRMVRVAVNIDPKYRFPFRRPKELLKRALARHVGRDLAYRRKLGFGQPVFEWLSPGGQLRPLVDAIGPHEFLDKGTLSAAKDRPDWFLFNLLCYDIWHKIFIQSTPVEDLKGLASG